MRIILIYALQLNFINFYMKVNHREEFRISTYW
jgi:hypothetical protein